MKATEIGASGEKEACKYLEKHNYKIIEKNFRRPYGELDIVASRGGTVVFVEVKTRRSAEYGLPCEAVTVAKRRRLIRTAYAFIEENGLEANYRFDIIEVYRGDGEKPSVRHIENAFEVEW